MNKWIEIEKFDEVVHIFLNRPEKKNALSLEMMGQLLEVLKSVEGARVVVLEGRGDFFCSGMDLEDVKKYGSKCAEKMGEVFLALTALPCVTIAKVRGGAVAGGLGLVASCDMAFASEESIFALPELQKGLVPAYVSSLLKGQCQPRFLNEMVLTGDRISVEKAVQAGLINHVAENLDLVISKLLKNAPLPTELFKKNFIQRDLRESFKKAAALHAQVSAK